MLRQVDTCPRSCGGYVHFKLRIVDCVNADKIGMTDIVCDTCDYTIPNVFDLSCWTSCKDLIELVKKDAEEMGSITITQVMEKYNIDSSIAIELFARLGMI